MHYKHHVLHFDSLTDHLSLHIDYRILYIQLIENMLYEMLQQNTLG